MMAVVKANAYGHGVLEISKTVLANGADALGVARIDEGLLIRKSGIDAPILILGYTSPDHTKSLVRYDLTQTVGSLELAESFSKSAEKEKAALKIQLKIDTGMGRLGFLPDPLLLPDNSSDFSQILKEMEAIIRLPNLLIQGIYTHFARADIKDKFSMNWLSVSICQWGLRPRYAMQPTARRLLICRRLIWIWRGPG